MCSTLLRQDSTVARNPKPLAPCPVEERESSESSHPIEKRAYLAIVSRLAPIQLMAFIPEANLHFLGRFELFRRRHKSFQPSKRVAPVGDLQQTSPYLNSSKGHVLAIGCQFKLAFILLTVVMACISRSHN